MTSRFSWLNRLPFAPIVAAVFGLVAAILTFATPLWLFERAVVATGLPGIFPPARPPLGDTARLGAAFIAGLATFAALWAVLTIISRITKARIIDRGQKARGVRIEAAPIIPHRAPIFAEQELGAPFMSQEAIDVARSELVLETPLDDTSAPPIPAVDEYGASDDPVVAAVDTAAPVETSSVEVRAQDLAQAIPDHAELVAVSTKHDDSISGLMSRLENALDRLHRDGRPMPMGNVAALRRAIGAGR